MNVQGNYSINEKRETHPTLKDDLAPAVTTTTFLPKSGVNSVKSTVTFVLSILRTTAYVSCPGKDLNSRRMKVSSTHKSSRLKYGLPDVSEYVVIENFRLEGSILECLLLAQLHQLFERFEDASCGILLSRQIQFPIIWMHGQPRTFIAVTESGPFRAVPLERCTRWVTRSFTPRTIFTQIASLGILSFCP